MDITLANKNKVESAFVMFHVPLSKPSAATFGSMKSLTNTYKHRKTQEVYYVEKNSLTSALLIHDYARGSTKE